MSRKRKAIPPRRNYYREYKDREELDTKLRNWYTATQEYLSSRLDVEAGLEELKKKVEE